MTVRRIGVGLYIKGDELHVDCVEICTAMGVPATPENMAIAQSEVLAAYEDVVGHGPDEVVEHDGPPPWRGRG